MCQNNKRLFGHSSDTQLSKRISTEWIGKSSVIAPFSRRIARSQQESAHSASWVITRMVRPIPASLRMIWLTLRILAPSSPLVGSSRIIIGASCIKATPKASRCFCPPDRVAGCCSAYSSSSRALRIVRARALRFSSVGAPVVNSSTKYSLQGTTQGNGLTGGVPPVRFSM
mgnify:CR=1 FL=1